MLRRQLVRTSRGENFFFQFLKWILVSFFFIFACFFIFQDAVYRQTTGETSHCLHDEQRRAAHLRHHTTAAGAAAAPDTSGVLSASSGIGPAHQ